MRRAVTGDWGQRDGEDSLLPAEVFFDSLSCVCYGVRREEHRRRVESPTAETSYSYLAHVLFTFGVCGVVKILKADGMFLAITFVVELDH